MAKTESDFSHNEFCFICCSLRFLFDGNKKMNVVAQL